MVNPIKNMKILFKIMLIIINIVVFMIILAVVMTNGLGAQRALIEELADVRFDLYQMSSEMLKDILILDSEFEILILKSQDGIDPEEGQSFKEKTKSELDPHITKLEGILTKDYLSNDERSHFEVVYEELKRYRQTGINIAVIGQLGGSNALLATRNQAQVSSIKIREVVSTLHEYESNLIINIKDISLSELKKQSVNFYIICIISIIIPLIISFFIARSIVIPIKYLVVYSQQIAEGDLRNNCDIHSRDEMGNLSDYFNRVVLYIKEFINSIKNIQTQNIEVKNKLIEGTSETCAAITEISTNLNSSVNMLNNLNKNVESSVNASDDISHIVEEFRQQIDDQSASVTQSSASIEQIIGSIKNIADLSDHRSKKSQELLELTEIGKTKMGESNKQVKEMSAITDNMLEAIDIIKDIAEQTNLLSINSAIEAAHAGEAGKSFAVVSDEIRKLAESSTESSKLISNNLQKNVNMIKSILKVSDETSVYFQTIGEEVKQVVTTLEEISIAMQTLATSGNQISIAITNLRQLTGDVQCNSTNIEDKVQQIKSSIAKVDNVTTEVVNAISEINYGAKQINNAMSQLNQNATLIEKGIVETSRRVDKFITC